MEAVASFFTALVVTISSWLSLAPSPSLANLPVIPPAPLETQTVDEAPDLASVQPQEKSSAKTNSVAGASTEKFPTGSAWLASLPLGDGKYVTSGPKKGFIYVCHVQSGGGGAQAAGPWIHGPTWNPAEKIHVQGNVEWPEATYSARVSGSIRTITSNDLPTDHTTGIFPIGASDPAAQYDRNPSSISAHSYSFSLPAYPIPASSPGCIYGEVGIMGNGVLLFDGFDAEYRDALAHEVQDDHDGHPNNEGYHKHGFIAEIKNLAISKVAGFAFDGYPITGPLLPSGKYLTSADLDECHGIESEVQLDGKLQKTYHYVLTQDFPYSVSCFHGTSKVTPQTLKGQSGSNNPQSGAQIPQQGGQGPGGNPPAPPQEAIDACSGKAPGAACSVGQSVTGTCANIGAYFACLPR